MSLSVLFSFFLSYPSFFASFCVPFTFILVHFFISPCNFE